MKKLMFLLALAAAIFSCGSPSGNAPGSDKNMTVPSDTAKIDTVKATDSIIKG